MTPPPSLRSPRTCRKVTFPAPHRLPVCHISLRHPGVMTSLPPPNPAPHHLTGGVRMRRGPKVSLEASAGPAADGRTHTHMYVRTHTSRDEWAVFRLPAEHLDQQLCWTEFFSSDSTDRVNKDTSTSLLYLCTSSRALASFLPSISGCVGGGQQRDAAPTPPPPHL